MDSETISAWKDLTGVLPDPVFGLIHTFLADTDPKKVLLGVGAYRDDDGKPYVLECVKKAEQRMLDQQNKGEMFKEYAFPDGIPSFCKKAVELGYGADHCVIKEERLASMQTVSGTGGLRTGFAMLKSYFPQAGKKVYVPNPTWSLHHNIIARAGFELNFFRYYNRKTKGIDMPGMLEDLDKMEDEQILLLQVSCFNPAGTDPTQEEWHQILEICQRKKHFVFMDVAYQGYGGSLDEDAWSVRLFAEKHVRTMLSMSMSKNFGLYGERTGCLSIVCKDTKERDIVQSRMKETCLPEYSNPPIHGARIVDTILGDEELTKEWKSEVAKMANRLRDLRVDMVDRMAKLGSTHDWSHISKQRGMFAYTGLTPEMVIEVFEKYHIYMAPDGRISVAGVNSHNIDHVTNAFHQVSHGKEF